MKIKYPSASDQIAVITGGSKGIGKAIAHEFLKHGFGVLIIARNTQQLSSAKQELEKKSTHPVFTLALDVTTEDASDAILLFAQDHNVTIRFLVNNAAYWLEGPIATSPGQDLERLIDCNMAAPAQLTLSLLPTLLETPGAGLLNVGSLAGEFPFPEAALYGASKSFLHSWTRALCLELQDREINVSLLAPGFVDTQFTQRPNTPETQPPPFLSATAESVAWAGYRGLQAGESTIVPGLSARAMYLAIRILPHSLINWLQSMFRAF